MAATAQDLYRVVGGQVGYVEGGGRDGRSGNITKYGAKFGMNAVAWCSIFVWWCFLQIGIDLRKVITGSYASAEQAMEGWARHGWKIYRQPKLMDVAFFHFPGEAPGADHTGFVVAADAGGVHTIEGNTSSGNTGSQSNGGGVYRRYRPYSTIIGYGRYPWPKTTPPPAVPKVKPVVGKAYPTLQFGEHDKKVERLQTLLHIHVDGIFGAKTQAAVKAFQKRHHLIVDGVAGPATLKALGF